MKVADVLRSKGAHVLTVPPEAGIPAALHKLQRGGIGALVVSVDGATIDGIISERDIVRRLAEQGARLLDLSVREVMTRNVTTCVADDQLTSVMAEMTRRRIRHLPVVDGGRLVGIVSIGDVVKARLEELELETHVLRDAYLASH